MRIDGLACRRSEQVTLYTVLATWSIRSKKLHLEREKDFPSLDLAMVAMDTRRLVEDRTQLLCVHSGQEWSVKYGSRRGKKRVGMPVPLLRKGRGFAPVIRWRNRRGRLRDHHESSHSAGSRTHDRKGMVQRDDVRNA
jgi:hypothetical protein